MSVVFGLSIYIATTNNSTLGNENVVLGYLGGGNSNKKAGL